MDWIQKKQDNLLLSGVAPKVRTGGSATTGQAALPHRNNHKAIVAQYDKAYYGASDAKDIPSQDSLLNGSAS